MFSHINYKYRNCLQMESEQNCDPDAKKHSAAELNFFILSKMKNVAKIEIVLHDPYSNALIKPNLT